MTSIVLCFFSEYCQTFEVDGIKQDMPQKVFLTWAILLNQATDDNYLASLNLLQLCV